MEIFKLFGSIIVDNDKANKSLDNTDKKGQKTGKTFGGMIKSAAKWGAAIGAAALAAGGAMLGLASKTGEYADRILDLNAITGMSTDRIQEWQNVAKVAGVDTETITKASEKLTKSMSSLAKGTGKGSAALKGLGLTYADLEKASPDERMDMVTKALAGIEDPAERARLGTDLLGGSWKDLAPIVSMGAEGMDAAKQAAHDMGAVLSEDALNDANNFRIAMENVKTTLSGAALQIGAKVAPVLTAVLIPALQAAVPFLMNLVSAAVNGVTLIIGWIQKFVQAVKNWTSNNQGQLNQLRTFFMNFFNNVIQFVKSFISMFMSFWNKYGQDILSVVQKNISFITSVFRAAFTLIGDLLKVFTAIFKGDWKGAFDAVVNLVGNFRTNLANVFRALVDLIKTILSKLDLKQIGINIIQGLINGISSMIGKVKEKAGEIANAIGDKVKSFFGINSPSRLMMEYGGNIGDGLSLGLEKSENTVSKASESLAKTIPSPFSGETSNSNNISPSKPTTFTQEITIHSPTPLSPSEIKRKLSETNRELGLEWGLI
jgi:phage-related minor tail protein